MPWKERGYTLYELMLTMLLVAVIAGLGIPSFARIGARAVIHTEINALFHAIHLARKESVVRKRVVSLCPSVDLRTCTQGAAWSTGWLMFENTDKDWPPRRDPAEPLLQAHKVRENVQIMSNRRGYTLRSTQKRATDGTLVVCDRRDRVAPVALVSSYTGRPRVAEKTPRGDPYFCAD